MACFAMRMVNRGDVEGLASSSGGRRRDTHMQPTVGEFGVPQDSRKPAGGLASVALCTQKSAEQKTHHRQT